MPGEPMRVQPGRAGRGGLHPCQVCEGWSRGRFHDGPPPHRPAVDPDRSGPGGGWAPWPLFPRTRPACPPDGVGRRRRARRPRRPARRPARPVGPGARGAPGRPGRAGARGCRGRGSAPPSTRCRAAARAAAGSRVEPGGQVELSGPPARDVADAVAAVRADRAVLCAALAGDAAGSGAARRRPAPPAASGSTPRARYAAMEEHFAAVGCAAAGPGDDDVDGVAAGQPRGRARRRMERRGSRWPTSSGPVLVAVSACSPLLAGPARPAGGRIRQQVWGELDQARCGPLLGGDRPGRRVGRLRAVARR